ncbi:MAG: glycosyltransferase family 2 protein [Bacteroidales bacterium]|nr:glycosyltransferase family 2 protein [Bacteroidales bacterium]
MHNNLKIAVAIPCYKVEQHLQQVVAGLPDFVDSILLVDDCSPDGTPQLVDKLAASDPRIIALHHKENLGVGGSMRTAFSKVLETDIDVVVKLDGDGQMDSRYISPLVEALTHAEFAKGNRLFDRTMLRRMPALRRLGNMGIGFMVKASSGYWNVSDPVNGFFAIRTSTLKHMELERLSQRFFFESSMLIELHYTGARIKEVSMPAIYGDEKSNLSIGKTLFSFPPRLFVAWLRRIHLSYFVFDFNICSLYLLIGLPSFLFGLIFGICEWIHYASINSPSPTGTIMVAVLTFILGFQMLLAAAQYDVSAPNPFEKNKLDD